MTGKDAKMKAKMKKRIYEPAGAHTWPKLDSAHCPLPCSSVLNWKCCSTSVCDNFIKELGFNVPLFPHEYMAGVTESFTVCRNQRDGRFR